jgi:predicted LPLAT superfamily acyltransferase
MIARNPSPGTWKRFGRARNMGSQTYVAGREHIGDSLVDGAMEVPQHRLTMPETGYDKVRRSTRVFMRVRVVVAGKNSDHRRFREACETIVISAHGGLMYLNQPLAMDAILVLTNPFTQEEQECRVVFLGEATEKGQRVGVEFLTPAPHFWGVDFVPTDWPAAHASVRPS